MEFTTIELNELYCAMPLDTNKLLHGGAMHGELCCIEQSCDLLIALFDIIIEDNKISNNHPCNFIILNLGFPPSLAIHC